MPLSNKQLLGYRHYKSNWSISCPGVLSGCGTNKGPSVTRLGSVSPSMTSRLQGDALALNNSFLCRCCRLGLVSILFFDGAVPVLQPFVAVDHVRPSVRVYPTTYRRASICLPGGKSRPSSGGSLRPCR